MSISLACPTVGQDERPRTPNRQDSDNDTVYSSDYEAQEGSSSPSRRGMEGRWFTVDIWPWHIHGTLYFSFLFKVKLLVLVEWWQLRNMSWGCPGSGYVEVTSFSGSETINSPSIPQYNRCNLWTSQPMVGWWSMLMVYSSSNPLLEWWHGDWPSKPPTLPINQPFTLKCQWTPRISITRSRDLSPTSRVPGVDEGHVPPKKVIGFYVSRRFLRHPIEERNFRCLVPLLTFDPIPTFRDANSAAVSSLTLYTCTCCSCLFVEQMRI